MFIHIKEVEPWEQEGIRVEIKIEDLEERIQFLASGETLSADAKGVMDEKKSMSPRSQEKNREPLKWRK